MLPYLTASVLNTSATGFIIHRCPLFVKGFFYFFSKKFLAISVSIDNAYIGTNSTFLLFLYSFFSRLAISSGVKEYTVSQN